MGQIANDSNDHVSACLNAFYSYNLFPQVFSLVSCTHIGSSDAGYDCSWTTGDLCSKKMCVDISVAPLKSGVRYGNVEKIICTALS